MKRLVLIALCAIPLTVVGCDCGSDFPNDPASTPPASRDSGSGNCVPALYHPDLDGDEFGDPHVTYEGCNPPAGYIADGTDCNDSEARINPRRGESCNHQDDNCNGEVDEGWDTVTVYRDADGDTYGSESDTLAIGDCPANLPDPVGYVRRGGDCDDQDPAVFPELCYPDADRDGHGSDQAEGAYRCQCRADESRLNDDCNDALNTVFPGAPEICDRVDNDCDQDVDENLVFSMYRDTDGDGYGLAGPANTIMDCAIVSGYAFNHQDCNDADPDIHPNAEEIPGDDVDQDCDQRELCYLDQDEDGARSATETVSDPHLDCSSPGSAKALALVDCNDADRNFNWLDEDGDGESTCGVPADCDDSDPLNTAKDFDHDGFMACDPDPARRDCNDFRNDVHPDAEETLCDGVDNDCDQETDENLTLTVCLDGDGDGFGKPDDCEDVCPGAALVNQVVNAADCDDLDPTAHPLATEHPADGLDSDCDGFESCYADTDGDGFGSETLVLDADFDCASAGSANNSLDCDDGHSAVSPLDNDRDGYFGCSIDPALADCDDTDASNHPDAPEYCDGVDNNCDGQADEVFLTDSYPDSDGDGYGDAAAIPEPAPVCPGVANLDQLPAGFVANSLDCDDADPAVNADDDDHDGASECDPNPDCDDGDSALNLKDEDGDGANTCDPEPDCDDSDMALNVMDSDGDGATTCDPNPDCDDTDYLISPMDLDRDGYASCPIGPAADCHDFDSTIHPGAYEIRDDGVDQDCNGSDLTDLDIDDDRDGLTENQGDCNDSRSDIGLNQPESCEDQVDNDCDGQVNELCPDFDHDGDCYCDAATCLDSANVDCVVLASGDCDDLDPDAYPGAPEVPYDHIDQDCNGSDLTALDVDDDGDGQTENQGDCHDGDPAVFLGAPEAVADNTDQDCDGRELCYLDSDTDGYGTGYVVADTNTDCDDGSAPTSSQSGDCNDRNSAIHPQANETLGDNIDQDCDLVDSCFLDEDDDGYGTLTVVADTDLFCTNNSAPTASVSGDCDDADPGIHPGAVEVCDHADNNCVSGIDENGVCNSDAGPPAVDAGSTPDTASWPDTSVGEDVYSSSDAGFPDTSRSDTAAAPDAGLPDQGSSDRALAPDASGPDAAAAPDASSEDLGPDLVDWGAQDRDHDGIPNAVDVINVLDLNQDQKPETVCVPAHLVLGGPWSAQTAYLQGTPSTYWSGMKTLVHAKLDPLTPIPGASQYREWCHDFSQEIIGNYIYRYVGTIGANGVDPVSLTDCHDWVRSTIDPFCLAYDDAYCRRIFASDGCQSILRIIGVHWENGSLSPM